jgi:hypothetical protein
MRLLSCQAFAGMGRLRQASALLILAELALGCEGRSEKTRNESAERVPMAISGAEEGSHLERGDHSAVEDDIRYVGSWSREETGGRVHDTRMLSTQSSASLSFTFLGDGVIVYREVSPRAGSMQVCVDDQCRTVRNDFPRYFGSQPYGVQGLERAIHLVRIAAVSGDFFDFGGVRVFDNQPREALKPGRYAEDHPGIRYFGSWIRQERSEDPRPVTGWVSTSLDSEAGARVSFEGTGFVLYRGIYDDRLETSLCVDSGPCVRESGYSDALFWNQPMLLVGLPYGFHEAELRMLTGRAFDVESLEVLGALEALGPGKYRASHDLIRYFGNWNEIELDADGTRSVRQSRSPRATVYFVFEGTAIAVRVAKASDRGSIELCVDRRCEVFRTNRPGEEPTLAWIEARGLNPGIHHATLRKVDGRYLDLAGIEVDPVH